MNIACNDIQKIEKVLDLMNQESDYDFDYNRTDEIPTSSKGKLYLGGVKSLLHLKEHHIDVIISLCPVKVNTTVLSHIILDIDDIDDDKSMKKMTKIIDENVNLIHEYLQKGKNVLVHCLAGVSRSPTLVAAYLMISSHEVNMKKLSVIESLIKIKENRSCIYPNKGFLSVLLQFYISKLNE